MERRDSKRSIFKALFTGWFFCVFSLFLTRARNGDNRMIRPSFAFSFLGAIREILTAILDPLAKGNPPREYVRLVVTLYRNVIKISSYEEKMCCAIFFYSDCYENMLMLSTNNEENMFFSR